MPEVTNWRRRAPSAAKFPSGQLRVRIVQVRYLPPIMMVTFSKIGTYSSVCDHVENTVTESIGQARCPITPSAVGIDLISLYTVRCTLTLYAASIAL
jgi:hypothetical protein